MCGLRTKQIRIARLLGMALDEGRLQLKRVVSIRSCSATWALPCEAWLVLRWFGSVLELTGYNKYIMMIVSYMSSRKQCEISVKLRHVGRRELHHLDLTGCR